MSRSFDGASNSYYGVLDPTGRLDITGTQMTMCAWIKPAAGFLADHRFIASKSASTPANRIQYQLWINITDGKIAFATSDGVTADSILGPGAVTQDQWRWVAARKLGNGAGQLGLWTSIGGPGTQWATGTGTHSIGDTAEGFIIGATSVNSFRFLGLIAEVGVWNTALTDGELAGLGGGMSPLMVRPQNLAAYFPLWGNTGTSAAEGNQAPLGASPSPFITTPGTVLAAGHAPLGSPLIPR